MPSTKLSEWMAKNAFDDEYVANSLRKISRVQISRIRRGVSGASVKTAMLLQELTGIAWHHFVKQPRIAPHRRRWKRRPR